MRIATQLHLTAQPDWSRSLGRVDVPQLYRIRRKRRRAVRGRQAKATFEAPKAINPRPWTHKTSTRPRRTHTRLILGIYVRRAARSATERLSAEERDEKPDRYPRAAQEQRHERMNEMIRSLAAHEDIALAVMAVATSFDGGHGRITLTVDRR